MTKLEDGLLQLARMKGNKKLCKHVVRITVYSHLPKSIENDQGREGILQRSGSWLRILQRHMGGKIKSIFPPLSELSLDCLFICSY